MRWSLQAVPELSAGGWACFRQVAGSVEVPLTAVTALSSSCKGATSSGAHFAKSTSTHRQRADRVNSANSDGTLCPVAAMAAKADRTLLAQVQAVQHDAKPAWTCQVTAPKVAMVKLCDPVSYLQSYQHMHKTDRYVIKKNSTHGNRCKPAPLT